MNKVFLKFKNIILFIIVIILTACGNNILSNKKNNSNISNTSSSIVKDSYSSKYSSNMSIEKQEYKVTFDYGYDDIINIVYVKDYVGEPVAPSRDGYVFLGWYNDAEIFHFNKLVTNDIVLTAKWLNEAEFNNFLLNYEYTGSIIDNNVHVIKYKGTSTIINIPSWVISIEANAFKDCSNITEVHMTENVQSIGEGAFSGCGGLEKMILPFAGESINAGAANCLFGYIFGKKIYKNSVPIKQYYYERFFDTTIFVEYYVPENLKELTILSVCSGVSDSNCYYSRFNNIIVEKIIIGNSVTSIGESAFERCESLTSVIIPDSVTSIGDSAFRDCHSLTSVIIPDSVTSIGRHAFSGCISLTSVIIPDSVTSIGYRAFSNSDYCITIIYCEATSQPIGWDYSWNTSNTQAYWGFTKENVIDKNGAQYIIQNNNAILVRYFDNNKNFEILSIVEKDGLAYNVTSIGNYAFKFCDNLSDIVIPDSVTSIGYYAFSDCSRLANMIIPDSVISIGEFAFEGCRSLTNLTIGKNVYYIGSSAFKYCSYLKNIYFKGSHEDWNNIVFGDEYANPMYYADHFYILDANNNWIEVTDQLN